MIMSKLGRPLKPRDQVKSRHVGLKMTEEVHGLLQAIVADVRRELDAAGYSAATTSASMVVTHLIREEAKRRGL